MEQGYSESGQFLYFRMPLDGHLNGTQLLELIRQQTGIDLYIGDTLSYITAYAPDLIQVPTAQIPVEKRDAVASVIWAHGLDNPPQEV